MTDVLSGGALSGLDADERVVAKAALDAAEEQLRALCASHAGTFVSVERRGASLEIALRDLLQNLKVVESGVEAAQQALDQEEDDERSLAALSEKHRVRRRTLLQHSSLLELLELPSLMDACVRSNLYEEALSIAAFANTLERRHTEKNEVVVKVIAQVRSRQSDLRRHLLHCLKNHVTMPECLEIVTALRRLNSIDLERQSEKNLERVHSAMELSLQVDFLEARDAWLDQPATASNIPGITKASNSKISLNASEQLLDTIERYRTRMFEIATQFNAIFRSQTNSQKVSLSLLSMWISRRIRSFLDVLKVEIEKIEDSGALRDALDACVFFSTSMGRLGSDFTPQIPQLFESKMLGLVVGFWKEGEAQLNETLKICRDAGVASPLSSSAIVSTANGVDGGIEGDNGPMAPPRQLMALPPLGRLVNAYLSGLNELRRCLLPGLFDFLRSALEVSLTQVESMLQANERAVMTPGLRGDAVELRAIAKEMREVATTIVIPYVRGALELALGNSVRASEHHDRLAEILNPPTEEHEPTTEATRGDEGEGPELAEDIATTEFEGEVEATTAEEVIAAIEATSDIDPVVEDAGLPRSNEGWDDGLGDIQ